MAALLTVIEQPPEIVPPEAGHVGVPVNMGLESVTEVTVGLKPLPETVTGVPSGPVVGLSMIVAVFSTVNVAEAESPITLPVALTL